jgi:hypothetical protein
MTLTSDEDDEHDYISAPFKKDVRFIFKGFEADIDKCQGFRDATRSLIVDHILRNMNFNPEENGEDDNVIDTAKKLTSGIKDSIDASDATTYMKQFVARKLNLEEDEQSTLLYPGLSYMLDKEYFNEAFILHDEGDASEEFNQVLTKLIDEISNEKDKKEMQRFLEDRKKRAKQEEKDNPSDDPRTKLTQSWAHIKNIFKNQPLFDIRNYLGEYITFYFAFCATLISSLFLPCILGLASFGYGIYAGYVINI